MKFLLLLLCAGGTWTLLHAELTEEQKKELFRESQSVSSHEAKATGTKSGSTSGVHHHSPHPSPTPHASHAKKHSSAHSSGSEKSGQKLHHDFAISPEVPYHHSSESETVAPAASASPSSQSGLPHKEQASSKAAAPAAQPASVVPLSTLPSSSLPPLPHGATPSAPITISKSGAESEQGIEPAPTAAESGASGWNPFGWIFGSGSHQSYNYLTASTRSAIDHAPVRKGRWKYIIVHNSGTREGNARVFNIYHLRVRHMKNGLAYHFVIGDGHGSGDGEIEIGHRWTAQLNGGHVASDWLNDISLGICLVGDFNRDLPTKAQIGALEELIRYLRIRVGKTQGRQSIVYAHKEINPRPTDCPGDRFPYAWLHATFGQPN